MNDEERYLFDLQGFLVIPDALDPNHLACLNAALDERIACETLPDMQTHRFGELLARDQAFRDLIDNPHTTPYVEEVLGPGFRLDHDYADVIRTGLGPIGAVLHGGGTPFSPAEYYHVRDGRIHTGLTVVAYNLRDVGPEDGGFACVPGSHKSSFPFPDVWRDLSELHPSVRRITGPAGTAIIFTEALTHGTLPWRGRQERRTVFFKFSPAPLSWSARYYDADEYPDLTERRRAILEPPNSRYKGR